MAIHKNPIIVSSKVPDPPTDFFRMVQTIALQSKPNEMLNSDSRWPLETA